MRPRGTGGEEGKEAPGLRQRACPEASELIRMRPNAVRCAATGPDEWDPTKPDATRQLWIVLVPERKKALTSLFDILCKKMMGVPLTGAVTWNAHEIHKLIEFVRQKECLYASECPDYNNRDVVWAHWSEVSKILNKPAVACRDKWTNLRGVYRRLVMQSPYQRLPVRNKTRKTWSWEAYMAFLKPHLHHRKSSTRGPAEDKPYGVVDAHSQFRTDAYDHFASPHPHSHHHSSTHHQTHSENAGANTAPPHDGGGFGETPMGLGPAKTEVMDDFLRMLHTAPSSAATVAQNNRTQPPRSPHNHTPLGYKLNDEGAAESISSSSPPPPSHHSSLQQPLAGGATIVDPDEMFFKSIIPDIKLLPPREKGSFKLRVLQMLQDMLYPKPLSVLTDHQQQHQP